VRTVRVILWAIIGLLVTLALFGGVLDAAALLGVPISRDLAAFAAVVFLAIDRELNVLRLSWQLQHRRDIQSRIDHLAGFRDGMINDLYARRPSRKTFKDWKVQFHSWEDALVDYLKARFPYAVFEMFRDQGVIPSYEFEHVTKDSSIRKSHRSHLRRIAKHLGILETLIQQNTSLTVQREPGLGEIWAQLSGQP
jgi:hypothetical protein